MNTFIDDYLDKLPEAQKTALLRICALIREIVPEVEEGTSYKMPMFKLKGKMFMGFLATKNHLSLFPCSGAIVEVFKDKLEGFSLSKGTIRFTSENQIPENILRDIIEYKLKSIS